MMFDVVRSGVIKHSGINSGADAAMEPAFFDKAHASTLIKPSGSTSLACHAQRLHGYLSQV